MELGGTRSDGLGNSARTQTTRANANVLARVADDYMHAMQVRPLNALGLDVRVTDLVGNLTLLAANFTLRWHGFSGGGYH